MAGIGKPWRGGRTAVEFVGVGILGCLFLCGIGNRILEPASLPESARKNDMVGVDEEGRASSDEDEAAKGATREPLAGGPSAGHAQGT